MKATILYNCKNPGESALMFEESNGSTEDSINRARNRLGIFSDPKLPHDSYRRVTVDFPKEDDALVRRIDIILQDNPEIHRLIILVLREYAMHLRCL